jgi:hypothetical protein
MFVHLLKQNNGQYVSIAYKIRKCAHFATVRYIFLENFRGVNMAVAKPGLSNLQ